MSHAFVNITPNLADLCATHTLLTPNERLAREYQFAYDAYQCDQGLGGWPALSCVSLAQYLKAEFNRFKDTVLLSELASISTLLPLHRLIMEISRHAPVSSDTVLQTFAAAWQTIQRYDIDIDGPEYATPRMSQFKAWYNKVRSNLPNDVVIEERLGDWLIEHDVKPTTPLLLIEFEQLTAVEQRYLDFAASESEIICSSSALDDNISWPQLKRALGVPLVQALSDYPPESEALYGFNTFNEEVSAAAQWAFEVKQKHAEARIGIVIPDLAENYERVQHQCALRLDPENGSITNVFDLSAGVSLSAQPVWRAAQAALNGLVSGFDIQACRGLAQNPFLQLEQLSEFTQQWPAQFRKAVTAKQLTDLISVPTNLGQNLDLAQTKSFAAWVNTIVETLEATGWPHPSELNSTQYQAYQAIAQALKLYSLDQSTSFISFTQAVGLLESCLQHQLFAPQRSRSDIWVLGMLETTGLTFSHLWVCGMDENRFPGKSLTNPFIPRGVALKNGVPRSSQIDELAFAQRQLNHWRSHVEHLHYSFCQTIDDNEQHPSPLLSHLPVQQGHAPDHPNISEHPTSLEHYEDRLGLPLDSAAVNGGTGFLKDQADCAFKAYAQYRLQLKKPLEPSDYPNALVRGNILHDTLFELVRKNSTQAALIALTKAQIEIACRTTLAKSPRQFPEPFIEQEVARITSLILEWIKIESQREPFEATFLEETFTLNLDGLEFRIRIDRVDEVAGQLIVIDYKTGTVSLNGVTHSPTTEPQLPAYSLINERVSGVYYGEIKADAILKGVGDDVHALTGARMSKLTHNWSLQREIWHRELNELAADIRRGEASVLPSPRACDYCHLQSLCRIGELRER